MNLIKSKIYTGRLMHARLSPVKHTFEYPVYFFVLDLDELCSLDRETAFFGYNRWNVFSIFDADYLTRGAADIRYKLARFLEKNGISNAPARIELATCARYFGHIFNPVSFFYCYGADDKLRQIVAEVNNTFGERHFYLLKSPQMNKDGVLYLSRAAKEFHVSPFFDVSGEYEFKLSPVGSEMEMQVNLFKKNKAALVSRWWGKAKPLTSANLIRTVLRFPFSAALALPRIHWQAAKLYFGKKLPAYKKPVPTSPLTVNTTMPNWLEKFSMGIVFKELSKMTKGHLTLLLPDGTSKSFGKPNPSLHSMVKVNDYRFFWRIIRDGGIGLGESYMEEEWDALDVTAVLKRLIENQPAARRKVSWLNYLGDWTHAAKHRRRSNTVKRSKKNIRDHYDLGNNFFRLFLDESMIYSCGIFESPEDTLYEAQQNKINRILEKARINGSDRVLEIGCGWGAFAIAAVKKTGCRVTGITLSEQQREWALQRVAEEGLQDHIEILLTDYRHVKGTFDKIVSIEMLEAVGHKYLGQFFQTCDRLLNPEGLVVVQVITIPDQRYDSYRRSCDWIQKHIFPGGHLPCLTVLAEQMKQHSSLMVEDLKNIGPHYARTLELWRERFQLHRGRIQTLGFDTRRLRAWEYYFSYCEAAFKTRHLNNLQLVLTRTGNSALDAKIGKGNDFDFQPEKPAEQIY